MIGYRNLLISLFCSMAVSAAGQPRLVKSHRKLPITFARGIYKAMWPAIKVLN